MKLILKIKSNIYIQNYQQLKNIFQNNFLILLLFLIFLKMYNFKKINNMNVILIFNMIKFKEKKLLLEKLSFLNKDKNKI